MRLLFFISIVFLLSCSHNQEPTPVTKNDGKIAATINNQPIYLAEIDQSIKQEIYDELYRIYVIRKAAITETSKEYVLEQAAKNVGKDKTEFLEQYVKQRTTEKEIAAYKKKVNMNVIPELKRTLRYHDLNSSKGKELILESYRNQIIEHLVDSLKTIYKFKIFIEPPLPPKISIENIATYYRGNANSKITLLEVTDLECSKCREYYPVYKKIFEKYKSKIRFGFTHFSTYTTLCATAAECAGKQNKFWEMHDSIMQRKQMPDTVQVFQLAKRLNLDLKQFTSDFHNPELSSKLEYNFKLLKQCGLFGTPTILINGKPLFNSSSETEIENALNTALHNYNINP